MQDSFGNESYVHRFHDSMMWIFGNTVCDLTLKSNQLIFVSICTKDVNLAKFPQAAYGIER